MIGKTGRIGIFAIILTSLLVCGVSAVPQIPQNFVGTARLGGVATSGVAIRANWSNATTSYNWTATSGSSGLYTITITFDDTDTTNETEGCPSSSTVRFWIGTANIRNATATAGGATQTGFDLNASASCSDGVTNQNETFVDCGGPYCTACYALSVSPTSIDKTILPNASDTQAIVITNTGVYALAGLAVSAPTLAGGNITINFTAPSATLAAGATRTVTLNISASNGTAADEYTGTINVTATNSTSNGSISITVATSESTSLRRRTRYMDWNITGVGTDQLCVGKPVVVTVINDKDKGAIENSDIDVYLSEKKLFYLMTNANGQATFTPTKAGNYTVTGQKTRYKDLSEVISVIDCAPSVTTTVAPKVTTTVAPKPATTVEAATTTVAPKPATTVAPAAATTVPAAVTPVAKKGLNWTVIIIVLVVVIVVAAVLMKKGGSEKAPVKPSK